MKYRRRVPERASDSSKDNTQTTLMPKRNAKKIIYLHKSRKINKYTHCRIWCFMSPFLTGTTVYEKSRLAASTAELTFST